VNVSITAFFITWIIPNLPVQVVTFVLFIVARLLCFSVLTEYCSKEFTVQHFGLVMGAGFMAASLPGAFTYRIVDVVLEKFRGNFWLFHLVCILVGIPLSLIIYFVHLKSQRKLNIINESKKKAYLSVQNTVVWSVPLAARNASELSSITLSLPILPRCD